MGIDMVIRNSQIVFRGIEAYHFIDYLEKHALKLENQMYSLFDVIVGVSTMTPHVIGRLEITQVRLTFQGETSCVLVLEEQFRKHFMTAGG
jgi:hypothetical protein